MTWEEACRAPYVMMICDVDYADEFDVKGFVVVSNEECREYIESLDRVDYTAEHYFGTNESVEFSSKEDYLSNLEFKPVSEEDFQTLKTYFGRWGDIRFGEFFWLASEEEN